MRKILAIFQLKLLLLRSNWGMLLMMTLTPILFTLVIGNMNGNQAEMITLYFVDQDQSAISGEVLQAFDPELYTLEMIDETTLFTGVQENTIQIGYIIPPGFGAALLRGDNVEIQIVRHPNQMNQQVIPTVLNSTALRLQSRAKTSEWMLSTLEQYQSGIPETYKNALVRQVVEAVDNGWKNRQLGSQFTQITSGSDFEYDQTVQSSTGYLIFFLMFTLTFGINEILDEKKNGTWARLMSTPTGAIQVLGGHFLGTMLIGALQAILLVGFGTFVMGVQWGRSPFGVILVLFALIFALTSLGLALAGLIQSRRQLQSLYPVLIVSTSMLGGCMWPLEIVPPFMQTVALFIPQGQAMMALTDLIVRGTSIITVLPHILVLMAMGFVFFSLGALKIHREM